MSTPRTLIGFVASCAATLCAATRADEGWAGRDHEFASRQLGDFMSRHQRNLVDPIARGVRHRRPVTGRSGTAALLVPQRADQVPAAMAAAYPERDRARMERVFRELLAGYGQIERHFGLPPRDLAGAVAAFIAGSYMGYRHTAFPDAHFLPLVRQVRGVIAADPAYAGSTVETRQDMYERLAILAMFMAGAQMELSQRPDPAAEARMRAAGADYLARFLKTDAARIALTAEGLVLQ